MSNFIYALNATMPVFLVIVLGYFLRQVGMLNDAFCNVGDKFVFKIALPLLLFKDIVSSDIYALFDLKYVIFCACATTVMFFGVWFCAKHFLKDKSLVGAFSQAAARSSAAILGIAFVTNIYGDSGMMPLMIVSAVPFFNIFSVIILTFSSEENNGDHGQIKRACINVCKNPIIIGILVGLVCALFRFQMPAIISKTVTSVSNLATPLALICIGATFEGRKAIARIKPTIWATMTKLVLLPAILVPPAILLGYRNSALISILIMAGSPTTPSCYIMAKNMNNDTILTSSIVVSATLLSSVTLTAWIFLLKSLGYL